MRSNVPLFPRSLGTMRINPATWAVSIALIGALSGCTSGSSTQDAQTATTTITEAKATTVATLREFAATTPPSAITETFAPLDDRELLGCNDGRDPANDSSGSWPGSITQTLKKGTDVLGLLASIEESWKSRPGWKVTEINNDADRRRLEMFSPDGYQYLVSAFPSANGYPELRMSGFSVCVYIEGLDPFARF